MWTLRHIDGASLGAQMVKTLPAMQETWFQSLGQEDPLEKGTAAHCSILAWRIPWREDPGSYGLLSLGLQRVRHEWATNIFRFPSWCSGKESTHQRRRYRSLGFNLWVGKIPWRRKWQATPVFLPGKFHGLRSVVDYSPWSHKESAKTEHTYVTTHMEEYIKNIYIHIKKLISMKWSTVQSLPRARNKTSPTPKSPNHTLLHPHWSSPMFWFSWCLLSFFIFKYYFTIYATIS